MHFGVLAPMNHFASRRVSIVSFVLVNLIMDANSILNWAFGTSFSDPHGLEHSFLGALLIATIVSLSGFRSRQWIYGAFLGGVSHVLLDMFVHPEMRPLFPMDGNPFYMGWMEPLSLALLPLTVWFTFQCVSLTLDWTRKHGRAALTRTLQPSRSKPD